MERRTSTVNMVLQMRALMLFTQAMHIPEQEYIKIVDVIFKFHQERSLDMAACPRGFKFRMAEQELFGEDKDSSSTIEV